VVVVLSDPCPGGGSAIRPLVVVVLSDPCPGGGGGAIRPLPWWW